MGWRGRLSRSPKCQSCIPPCVLLHFNHTFTSLDDISSRTIKIMLFNPLWWTTKLWLFFCYIILFLFLWVCCYGCKRQGRGCIWERPQQWKSWNEIRHRPENLWHQIFSPNNRLYYPWARCSHSSDPPMSTGAYTVQRPSTSIFCVFSLLYSTHDKRLSEWSIIRNDLYICRYTVEQRRCSKWPSARLGWYVYEF